MLDIWKVTEPYSGHKHPEHKIIFETFQCAGFYAILSSISFDSFCNEC
jgi:hypothetical protein